MAIGDIQVRIRVSTWRLTSVLWAMRIALVVLPLCWVAPVVEWFVRTLTSGERLFRFLVRIRMEDSHAR